MTNIQLPTSLTFQKWKLCIKVEESFGKPSTIHLLASTHAQSDTHTLLAINIGPPHAVTVVVGMWWLEINLLHDAA